MPSADVSPSPAASRLGQTEERVAVTHYGFLSTYPPTRCGLATFTQALARALTVDRRDTAVVVRVLETDDDARPRDIRASARVGAELIAGDPRSMADAVESLDDCDVAIVQHEYGIYGGQDGDEILDVLAAVTTPTIVVLHTVLPAPTAHQRLVLERVCDLAAGIVVMTSGAREILTEHYDVDAADVHVIPHGVANVAVEVAGPHLRKRILTWGLISPGKGIEWGIRAIAQLADLDHEVEYVVAGQTHPKVLAHAGESYRTALTDLIGELGIDTSVHLDGRYLDAGELAVLVASADVVLLPYDSRDQATSGVLAEAVAAGIPVVATGFPHAVELLAGGAGIVVAHEDPQSMASALRTILTADDVARRMRDVALRAAGETSWPAVASRYRLLSQDLRTAVAA
jgi:glycosyltransferase involved in cell wall biosynthesis